MSINDRKQSVKCLVHLRMKTRIVELEEKAIFASLSFALFFVCHIEANHEAQRKSTNNKIMFV